MLFIVQLFTRADARIRYGPHQRSPSAIGIYTWSESIIFSDYKFHSKFPAKEKSSAARLALKNEENGVGKSAKRAPRRRVLQQHKSIIGSPQTSSAVRASDLIHPLRDSLVMRAKYTGPRACGAARRRNLCRNDNVHNCLFRENNRFHRPIARNAALRGASLGRFSLGLRKEGRLQHSHRGNNTARCILAAISLSVGLCVCGALKIRANDRRGALARSRRRLAPPSCFLRHAVDSKRNATTLSDSDATRRPRGFCAFSMFMIIREHG